MGGPKRKPAKISPTRAGMPSLDVKMPAAVAMIKNKRMASVCHEMVGFKVCVRRLESTSES